MSNIVTHPADSGGCYFYRIKVPSAALGHFKHVDKIVEAPFYLPQENFRGGETEYSGLLELAPKVIITQRQTEGSQADALERYSSWGYNVLHDLDDLLWNVPAGNPYINHFGGKNLKALRRSLKAVNRSVVSTEPLREEMLSKFGINSLVLPNFVSGEFLTPPRPRKEGGKLRVGWAGSSTHRADLAPLLSVVRETEGIYQWVFLGWAPDEFKDHIEFHPPVKVQEYLPALKALDLDLAIAPLELNRFNECKSHLKLLEFSALGMPVVCSQVYPYQESPGILIKPSNKEWRNWLEVLDLYDKSETLRMEDAQKHYRWAQKYVLEQPWNVELIRHTWLD